MSKPSRVTSFEINGKTALFFSDIADAIRYAMDEVTKTPERKEAILQQGENILHDFIEKKRPLEEFLSLVGLLNNIAEKLLKEADERSRLAVRRNVERS